MNTGSNLIIEDGYRRIQLYRFWDGYPEGPGGVLAGLRLALPYAWPFPQFQADDFAAAIVRAWKNKDGGNIYIDGSPKAWELIHGDTEWVYVIKPKAPAKSEQGMVSFCTGEPIVEIYDWHKYCFGKADLNVSKPRPVKRIQMSEAWNTGLAWKR